MKIITFSLLTISLLLTACEIDDDVRNPLIYDVCDASLTFLEDEKTTLSEYDSNDVPNNIRTYVASEFPGYTIQTATSFEIGDGSQYIEAIIDDNGRLLFDFDGVFLCGDESISSNNYGDDRLPQIVLDYIVENYPNATIDQAELEDGEYEVELSNGIDLCFDAQGNFIGEGC